MAGRIWIPPYRPLDVGTPAVPGGGYINVHASAGRFSPSPLMQLGLEVAEGIPALAGAVAQQLARDDEAVVKDADARLGEAEQKLLFDPQDGYLNIQGQEAVTRSAVVLDAYRETQQREADTLENDAQRRMLKELAERRLATFAEQVERHTETERLRWHDTTSDRRIATMRADAGFHWSDDALLRRALGTTRAEVRDKAERHGWDSPLIQAALSQQTSRTLVSAIEAAVEFDPERARSLRTRYDKHIEASDRAGLDALLVEAQARERAQQASETILNATPPAGQAPILQWQLQQAEAISEPAIRAATVRRLHSAAAATEARARALGEQVLARVLKEGLTDPAQVPMRDWVALDPERRLAIETRIDHNAAGTEPAPNPALVDELATQMTRSPSAFGRRDLVPSIAHLPLPQWQRFREWQTGLRRNEPAIEGQLYAIKRGLQLATRSPPTDTSATIDIRVKLIEEIDIWRRIHGKDPDDSDIEGMLERYVHPAVFVPPSEFEDGPRLRPGIHRIQNKSEEDDRNKGGVSPEAKRSLLEILIDLITRPEPTRPGPWPPRGQTPRPTPPAPMPLPRLPGQTSPTNPAPLPTSRRPPAPAPSTSAAPPTPRETVRGSDAQWGDQFGRHGAKVGVKDHQEYRELANRIRNDPNAKVTRHPPDDRRYPGETHYEAGGRLLSLDANGEFKSLRLVPPPSSSAPATSAPKQQPGGASHSPPAVNWKFGASKTMETWNNQMVSRGWTLQDINDAIATGKSTLVPNRVNPGNAAMRYEHPATGKGVILDMKTREVIQIEGPDFQ